ncbi:MAG: universal stress protein, partial [Anaerolineae bacterium]|nr:universal stress protein [Anaerolineae bacterium]
VSTQPAKIRSPIIRIKRLVVALDASQQSIVALEAAADLAASLKAELRGVFVEDIELLRIADLPVAREVLYPCGTGCRIETDRLRRQLRAQASQARQALTSICERRHIRWSFETVRGSVESEVLAAANDADLLILGRVSRPLVRQVRMGSTARAAIQSSTSSVLLTHATRKIRSPVVTIFHDSPCGQRTLAIAIHVAQRTGGRLTILLPDDDDQKAHQYVRSQAAESLRRRKLVIRYRRLLDTGLATIQQAINSEASGVAILSECTLPSEDMQTLIEDLEHPVMLIR